MYKYGKEKVQTTNFDMQVSKAAKAVVSTKIL